jgi:hypothetical protein
MKRILAAGLAVVLTAAGCSSVEHRSVGVYVLITVDGRQSAEIDTARDVVEVLLQNLAPADTLAAASIGTVGFSDANIIAAVNFDQRPSVANDQKRAFHDRFDGFIRSAGDSTFSDLTGGMLQAIETLNRSGSDRKMILIVSDLKQKPTSAAARDLPVQMTGFSVVILKPDGLQLDSRDMKLFLRRLKDLRRKVQSGNGRCHVIDSPQQLVDLL